MSSALPKPLKDSLATRPAIQITHTRGGRQSLSPVDTIGKQLCFYVSCHRVKIQSEPVWQTANRK